MVEASHEVGHLVAEAGHTTKGYGWGKPQNNG